MISRSQLADTILSIIQQDVDEGIQETEGKNRSPRIDCFNARVGAPLGSPYCASAGWCAIQDACDQLGLKNPVKKTAWSQSFRPPYVKEKYVRKPGELGLKGDVGVFQTIGNSALGHYTTLREDQIAHPEFLTIEYNTNPAGSREGDGVYYMTRSTRDKSGTKFFLCFTDVPQWILDFNKSV